MGWNAGVSENMIESARLDRVCGLEFYICFRGGR